MDLREVSVARAVKTTREGCVSAKQAREEYGVLIDPVTGAVLPDETAKLRAAMRDGKDRDGGALEQSG